MTTKNHEKRAARELAELRGCGYTAALAELRELPAGTDLRIYVARVRAEAGRVPLERPVPTSVGQVARELAERRGGTTRKMPCLVCEGTIELAVLESTHPEGPTLVQPLYPDMQAPWFAFVGPPLTLICICSRRCVDRFLAESAKVPAPDTGFHGDDGGCS